MGYEALRKGRVSETNRAYCITTVTQNRKPLFNDIYLARMVINAMKNLHDDGHVISLSWVLMPDHLHWLFQLAGNGSNEFEPTLSGVMKHMKAASACRINDYLGEQGSVWQKAFYDRGVRDDEDIKSVARYIVANPLRARLVENIMDYPHWDAAWL